MRKLGIIPAINIMLIPKNTGSGLKEHIQLILRSLNLHQDPDHLRIKLPQIPLRHNINQVEHLHSHQVLHRRLLQLLLKVLLLEGLNGLQALEVFLLVGVGEE
jgi:hypothetical protein